MAYTKPSVLVYQELINAGGAANISPDLPACIVGVTNNSINIDFNDEIATANSLAMTINTISDLTNPLVPVDWKIPVNQKSAYAGQVINDTSVKVVLRNPLVHTYKVTNTVTSGVCTVDSSSVDNTVGTLTTNRASQVIPFNNTSNHVSVGDIAIVSLSGSTVGRSFVISVVATGDTDVIALADTSLSGDTLNVYSKMSTSVATADWTAEDDVLSLGPLSDTIPFGTTSAQGYAYKVENEIKGGTGSPIDVHIGYIAARSDLDGTIGTVNNVTDSRNQLGVGHPIDNPLAFGVEIALANSGSAPVHFIGLEENTLAAHTAAATLAEGQLLYWMVPLTNEVGIQAMWKSHVNAMSLPGSGSWRVALFNQTILDELYVLGRPDGGDLDGDGFQSGLIPMDVGGTTVQVSTGDIGSTNAGDTISIYDAEGAKITGVVSDAQGTMIVVVSWSTAPATGTVYRGHVSRTGLTRQEQAQTIADQSATYSDKRVLNMPGNVMVTVNDVNTEVEGFYMMCAIAGFGSGVVAQQGMTNITFAGINDLVHANFYFSEAQLNLMAEFGTFLCVQEAQGTTPYCRHGLTTDVSVLEYREILKVKNWDYLSYYYKSLLAPFIGTWNITPDTLQTIRQTITSGSERLLGRKLPKIGPPLLSYSIPRLEQNPNSADSIDVDIKIAIVSPNNYTNVYLQI